MTLPAVSPESELFEDLESAVAADSVSVVSSDSSVAPAAPYLDRADGTLGRERPGSHPQDALCR